MVRVLRESAITTRNARANLPVGLHWRGIDREVHLGYRKKKRGGSWLVRWRAGTGYRQAPVGTADDALAEGTLSYEPAMRAAKAIVEAARTEAKIATAGPAPTIRDALVSYAGKALNGPAPSPICSWRTTTTPKRHWGRPERPSKASCKRRSPPSPAQRWRPPQWRARAMTSSSSTQDTCWPASTTA